jgi:hypothetical protein
VCVQIQKGSILLPFFVTSFVNNFLKLISVDVTEMSEWRLEFLPDVVGHSGRRWDGLSITSVLRNYSSEGIGSGSVTEVTPITSVGLVIGSSMIVSMADAGAVTAIGLSFAIGRNQARIGSHCSMSTFVAEAGKSNKV